MLEGLKEAPRKCTLLLLKAKTGWIPICTLFINYVWYLPLFKKNQVYHCLLIASASRVITSLIKLWFAIDLFCLWHWIGSHTVIDLQYFACHWWITSRLKGVPNYPFYVFHTLGLIVLILMGAPQREEESWWIWNWSWSWKCLVTLVLCSREVYIENAVT